LRGFGGSAPNLPCCCFRIYFEDTDASGAVYHANYLRFAERARTEAMRAAGAPHAALLAEHGLLFVVRRAKMDYVRPARLDDLLCVTTTPLAIRGASVLLRQDFSVADAPVGSLEILLACVGRADGRPARIPDRFRAVLAGAPA
jgi:acyl-CoA thioester hydrolase